jgi:hypothetical protein
MILANFSKGEVSKDYLRSLKKDLVGKVIQLTRSTIGHFYQESDGGFCFDNWRSIPSDTRLFVTDVVVSKQKRHTYGGIISLICLHEEGIVLMRAPAYKVLGAETYSTEENPK